MRLLREVVNRKAERASEEAGLERNITPIDGRMTPNILERQVLNLR